MLIFNKEAQTFSVWASRATHPLKVSLIETSLIARKLSTNQKPRVNGVLVEPERIQSEPIQDSRSEDFFLGTRLKSFFLS